MEIQVFWDVMPRRLVNNYRSCKGVFFFHGATVPSGLRPPHCRDFTITIRHTTVGRTPMDEWSVQRRDFYLTSQNTHKWKTSMPPAGLEPTIPAWERPQIYTLHRAATGIGCKETYCLNMRTVRTYNPTYVTFVLQKSCWYWQPSVPAVLSTNRLIHK
jgi:hypothetical protein